MQLVSRARVDLGVASALRALVPAPAPAQGATLATMDAPLSFTPPQGPTPLLLQPRPAQHSTDRPGASGSHQRADAGPGPCEGPTPLGPLPTPPHSSDTTAHHEGHAGSSVMVQMVQQQQPQPESGSQLQQQQHQQHTAQPSSGPILDLRGRLQPSSEGGPSAGGVLASLMGIHLGDEAGWGGLCQGTSTSSASATAACAANAIAAAGEMRPGADGDAVMGEAPRGAVELAAAGPRAMRAGTRGAQTQSSELMDEIALITRQGRGLVGAVGLTAGAVGMGAGPGGGCGGSRLVLLRPGASPHTTPGVITLSASLQLPPSFTRPDLLAACPCPAAAPAAVVAVGSSAAPAVVQLVRLSEHTSGTHYQLVALAVVGLPLPSLLPGPTPLGGPCTPTQLHAATANTRMRGLVVGAAPSGHSSPPTDPRAHTAPTASVRLWTLMGGTQPSATHASGVLGSVSNYSSHHVPLAPSGGPRGLLTSAPAAASFTTLTKSATAAPAGALLLHEVAVCGFEVPVRLLDPGQTTSQPEQLTPTLPAAAATASHATHAHRPGGVAQVEGVAAPSPALPRFTSPTAAPVGGMAGARGVDQGDSEPCSHPDNGAGEGSGNGGDSGSVLRALAELRAHMDRRFDTLELALSAQAARVSALDAMMQVLARSSK